jgi:flagellar hook-associated protein 3 FlgL
MRVTYNTISRNIQKIIMDRYSNIVNIQEQLSTGKRLLRPSDDPTDVANALKMRTKKKQLEQLKRNIEDGLGYMQVSDTAMVSLNTIMQRLRELTIQGSSDTLSSTERLYISNEVGQLLRQAIGLTNTQFKGDYVFAGTQTKIQPFPIGKSETSSPLNYTNLEMAYYDASAAAPGTPVQINDAFTGTPIENIIPGTFRLSVAGVTYQEGVDFTIDYVNSQITINAGAFGILGVDVSPGTANYAFDAFSITFEYIDQGQDVYGVPVNKNGDVLREIESGIVEPINTTSDQLLTDFNTGTNLLETIITLGQNLIRNNTTAINNSISDIDIGIKQLLTAQAINGARINRFNLTIERNETQDIETTRLLSLLEDAELAETATNFSVAETVYNAALQSAAKIIQPSLANFL